MKNYTKQALVLFAAMLFIMVSCKKDETTPEIVNPESFSFDEEAIIDRLPDALENTTDPDAAVVVGWVEAAANWSAFDSYFTPPDDAVLVSIKSTSYTYRWTAGYIGGTTLTYWWTYSEDATKNYWDLEIQIDDGPRAPFIEAWEMKDGTAGEVRYSYNWAYYLDDYDPDSYIDVSWVYTYSINAEGDYLFTWTYENDTEEYDNVLSYEVLVRADGSGYVRYYSQDYLWYYGEWDTDGNGYYVWYDTDGTELLRVDWTV
jgi:hypothetical protein